MDTFYDVLYEHDEAVEPRAQYLPAVVDAAAVVAPPNVVPPPAVVVPLAVAMVAPAFVAVPAATVPPPGTFAWNSMPAIASLSSEVSSPLTMCATSADAAALGKVIVTFTMPAPTDEIVESETDI